MIAMHAGHVIGNAVACTGAGQLNTLDMWLVWFLPASVGVFFVGCGCQLFHMQGGGCAVWLILAVIADSSIPNGRLHWPGIRLAACLPACLPACLAVDCGLIVARQGWLWMFMSFQSWEEMGWLLVVRWWLVEAGSTWRGMCFNIIKSTVVSVEAALKSTAQVVLHF